MNDLQDFELQDPHGTETPDGGEPEADAPGRKPWMWAGIAALVLLVVVVGWLWLRRPAAAPPAGEAPAAAPAVEPAAPLPAASEGGEPLDLPAVDASDELVRSLAAGLSARPELVAWMANEDLVRRFVVAVVNVAEGETPRPHLGFLTPRKPFTVEEAGSQVTIAPASYERYRTATEVFASLDTEGTVELYRRLEPLIDEAYRDLGYPQQDFDAVLVAALDVVLSVEPPAGPVELTPGVESFKFADRELEGMSPVEKQLLRLGPANLGRVQAKARELRAALIGGPAAN